MDLIWEMTYSASRRKHNHRCQYCSKIIKDGESVYMGRVTKNRTQAVHNDCANNQFGELTVVQHLVLHALKNAENTLWDYKGRYVKT